MPRSTRSKRVIKVLNALVGVGIAAAIVVGVLGAVNYLLDPNEVYGYPNVASSDDWQSPGNATRQEDDQCADAPKNSVSASIELTKIGLNMPQNSTVHGIKVEAKASTDADNMIWTIQLLKNGKPVGQPKKIKIINDITRDCKLTKFQPSGEGALWGDDIWTVEDINADNIGIRIIANPFYELTGKLDAVKVTIYY